MLFFWVSKVVGAIAWEQLRKVLNVRFQILGLGGGLVPTQIESSLTPIKVWPWHHTKENEETL
jgi:hypothetical protein